MHTGQAAALLRHVLPDFLGGEAEQRRYQPHQCFRNHPQDGLRRTAGGILGRKGINSVFDRINIKRAQLGYGKLVQRVINAVKFKVFIPAQDLSVSSRVRTSI